MTLLIGWYEGRDCGPRSGLRARRAQGTSAAKKSGLHARRAQGTSAAKKSGLQARRVQGASVAKKSGPESSAKAPRGISESPDGGETRSVSAVRHKMAQMCQLFGPLVLGAYAQS